MDFRNFFPQRFKLLRTIHRLSGKTISEFLNIKSTSNVTYWEQGKNVPSIELLCDISCLFGVSIDWLLGHVDNPYNEHFIEKLEIELLEVFKPDFLPAIYLNSESRVANFDLPVRANIIFVLNILYAFDNAFVMKIVPKLYKPLRYYKFIYDSNNILKKQPLKKRYEKYLADLLNNHSLFDLHNP